MWVFVSKSKCLSEWFKKHFTNVKGMEIAGAVQKWEHECKKSSSN